ncbi:amino acid permease [Sporomusaceae bacterium FL31]|nr:amino acid permease [Sporomusaceae bacterium FL31]
MMLKIKRHYGVIAKQLDIPNDRIENLRLTGQGTSYVIVPVQSLNIMVIKALRYAKCISNEVEAFHIETFEGEADKLKNKWAKLNTDIPLIIKQSPYRQITKPLVEYIESSEHSSKPGDIITVLLPQFIVSKSWEMALHNNTSLFIGSSLLKHRNIVVSLLPFYIDEKLGIYKNEILEELD